MAVLIKFHMIMIIINILRRLIFKPINIHHVAHFLALLLIDRQRLNVSVLLLGLLGHHIVKLHLLLLLLEEVEKTAILLISINLFLLLTCFRFF